MTDATVNASRWDDIAELTKPGIVVWVLITVAAGFYLAAPDALAGFTLFHTLLAAAAVATAAPVTSPRVKVVKKKSGVFTFGAVLDCFEPF